MKLKCVTGVSDKNPYALYIAEDVRVCSDNILQFRLEGILYKYKFSVRALSRFSDDLIIDCSKMELIDCSTSI